MTEPMNSHSLLGLFTALTALAMAGCQDERPLLYGSTNLTGLELAEAAALALGHDAPELRCNTCHALTRSTVRHWGDLNGLQSVAGCLEAVSGGSDEIRAPSGEEDALALLDCLRDAGGGEFSSGSLGILSTAAPLEFFEATFRAAYGAEWRAEYDDFVMRAGMPRGGVAPFTQAEFDVVVAWFLTGMEEFDTVFPPTSTGITCTPSITPAVATHVTAMETGGWQARNQAADVAMFGCEGDQAGSACLSTYPRATDLTYASEWEAIEGAQIRVLYTYGHASSFWTRSSADGRFVAHGGSAEGAQGGATIIDLAGPRLISSEGSFDPSFLPDNSGFGMQAVGDEGGLGLCQQSVLASPSLTHLTYTEAGCGSITGVNLYQHIGAVFDGDFFAVAGQFVSDDPGTMMLNNVPAAFDDTALTTLTPFLHNGSSYTARAPVNTETPHEGDIVISPSGRLLMSRMSADGEAQSGVRLRRIDATPAGDSYTVALPTIAEYCLTTTKVNFSFDERFVVFHRYVTDADAVGLGFDSAQDPDFAAYRAEGASNLFLLDLLDGSQHRVTNMQPGQYALFPHFRSDGLIYFVVKGSGADDSEERIAATDAALILAAP